MINNELKFQFWMVVSECLIEFHGLHHDEAYENSANLRGRLKDLTRLKHVDDPSDVGSPNEMIYHEEPFYLACNMTGRDIKLEKTEHRKKYQTILERHGWQS